MVSGDTLDFKSGTLLVGNYQGDCAFQLYDTKMCKEASRIPWQPVPSKSSASFHIYFSQFFKSPGDTDFIGGSYKSHQLRGYGLEAFKGSQGITEILTTTRASISRGSAAEYTVEIFRAMMARWLWVPATSTSTSWTSIN